MWCFVLPIFNRVIMDGHPIFQPWWTPVAPTSTTQNIGCPSVMTRLKMGKTKHPNIYSLNGEPCRNKEIFSNKSPHVFFYTSLFLNRRDSNQFILVRFGTYGQSTTFIKLIKDHASHIDRYENTYKMIHDEFDHICHEQIREISSSLYVFFNIKLSSL